MPCRCKQRWMALRDSAGLTQRRIASTMSSSGKARLRRSSTIRASSQCVRDVSSRCGRVERSGARDGPSTAPQSGCGCRARGPARRWCAALLDIGAGARSRGGIGVELEIHQPAFPWIGRCGAGVASGRRSPRWVHRPLPRAAPPNSRGSRCGARVPPMDYRDELRFLSQQDAAATTSIAYHNRVPSRQSYGTKHLRREARRA